MYSMEDNLSDLKGGTQVYYRLRRTESSAKWGWGETRDAQVEVIVADTVQADTARLDETDRLKAIITWEPFQGVWTNGTTYTLKKENVTPGETTNNELTEEENGQKHCRERVDQNE